MLGIVAVFAIIFTTLFFYLRVPQRIVASVEDLTAHMGFRIEDVMVIGRAQVDRNDLATALNAKAGDPMLRFDLNEATSRIGALSWVEEARVEKRWPNKIVVTLHERVPLAFWQRNQQLSLIDRDGQILTAPDLSQFHNLPVLVGANAPQNASGIFNALLKYPQLFDQVAALSWIGDRRWDLHLKNGMLIKLGESSPDLSLRDQCASLQQMSNKHHLLERSVATIDLRLPDRIILQTKAEEAATPPAPQQPGI